MTRTRLVVGLLAALTALGLARARTAGAAVFDYAKNSTAQYRMWIPDDVPVVDGFLVAFNGNGCDDRVLAESESYQRYARTLRFGVIGTFLIDVGHADDTMRAFDELATLSGHPEIKNAPIVAEGLSLGGYAAMEFAMAHPERTIAYVSGASRQLAPLGTTDRAKKTPGLYFLGETDGALDGTRASAILAIRAMGYEVAYYTQWHADHEWLYAPMIGRNFLSIVYALRYPTGASPKTGPVTLLDIAEEDGWLADPKTWESGLTAIAPRKGYAGDPLKAFWLPSRAAAFMYRGHATRDTPVKLAMNDWQYAAPGDPVAVSVSVTVPEADGGLADVAKLEVFDGDEPLFLKTQPPYTFTWTAQRGGAHGLTVLATGTSGTQRTGLIQPILVASDQPRANTGGPSSDGGPGYDGGGASDGGAGRPNDAGAVDGGPSNAASPDVSGGGCGCKTALGGDGARGVALLLIAMLAVSRRLGSTRPTRR